MDLIIDDGLHTLEGNVSFLENSLDRIVPGGTYIVEDIRTDRIDAWQRLLATKFSQQYSGYEFALVMLPNPANHYDNNNLLVIRRHGRF